MNLRYCICGIAVMAVVTYIPRALPLSVLRRKVKNRFLQAFLFYMPYTVLGAMTFPAILYSTSSTWSAAAGMAIALVLAYAKFNLLPVALASTAGVLLTEAVLHWAEV